MEILEAYDHSVTAPRRSWLGDHTVARYEDARPGSSGQAPHRARAIDDYVAKIEEPVVRSQRSARWSTNGSPRWVCWGERTTRRTVAEASPVPVGGGAASTGRVSEPGLWLQYDYGQARRSRVGRRCGGARGWYRSGRDP